MKHRTSIPLAFALALPLPLVGLSSSAFALPSSSTTYLDGDRVVVAERLGEKALDEGGRALTPIRLHIGARSVDVAMDDTAIVRLDEGGEQALAEEGLRIVEPLMPSIGLFRVESLDAGDGLTIASRLSTQEARAHGIRLAAPNLYLRLKPAGMPFVPDDPRFPSQWYFDEKRLQMTEAWGITQGDAKTTIVVIDSGCDMTHPDLIDKYDEGLDVIDNDTDPSYDPAFQGAEHGTACAGIVGAATNNAVGIAGGCPNCRIRCVRMLTDVSISLGAHIKAFNFAIDTGAAVVSNSWGFVDPMPLPQELADAINNVATNGRGGKGAVVMFAAGNDNRLLEPEELYSLAGTTTIGAVNQFYDKTNFTNFGEALDFAAPAGTMTTDIVGPGGMDPTDYTTDFGGTSSACPVAAGIAGLLISAMPDKSATEILDLMRQTAKKAPYAMPDENGHDFVFGYGILDAVLALKTGLGISDTPPPSPTPPVSVDTESCECRAGSAEKRFAGSYGLVYGLALAGLVLRRRARR